MKNKNLILIVDYLVEPIQMPLINLAYWLLISYCI